MTMPIGAKDAWYDRWLYKIGIVRSANYRHLYATYSDVFKWWAEKVQAEHPEDFVIDHAAELQRLHDAVMAVDPDDEEDQRLIRKWNDDGET